jgi:hypothetical protein
LGAEVDLVAIAERLHTDNPRAVDERAVLAAQVFDRRSRRGDDDARVMTRDVGRVDPDGSLRLAAQHVGPGRQRDLAVSKEEMHAVRATDRRSLGVVRRGAAEGVPVTVNGPDVPGLSRLVAESRP